MTASMSHSALYLMPPILFLLCGLALIALAVVRRKVGKENLHFAVLVGWYCLLAPVFIAHHLVGDTGRLLALERTVHFFYVYLPPIQIMFFHRVLGLRRPVLTGACFALSFLFSLTVGAPWYFSALRRYSWGYMAQAGWAFDLFGLYGFCALAYNLAICFQALVREANPARRRRQAYLLVGFGTTAMLTCVNVLPIHGIDVYPLGNFSFIPLAVMGYGLGRKRLVDLATAARRAAVWLLVSALVLVPNLALLFYIRYQIVRMPPALLVVLFAAWFVLNYIHILRVQQAVNKAFDRGRLALKQLADDLSRQAARLVDPARLRERIAGRMTKACGYLPVSLWLDEQRQGQFACPGRQPLSLGRTLAVTLAGCEQLLERAEVDTDSGATGTRAGLAAVMDRIGCRYLMPLATSGRLVGLLAVGTPADAPLTSDQVRFVEKVAPALAVGLDNAVMYGQLKQLKEQLEARTQALSREIYERMREQEKARRARRELEEANGQLEAAILQANEAAARAEQANYVLEQEIARHKETQRALEASEAKYRLLAENSTDVIWTLDMDLRFTFVSPSVAQLQGYTVEQAMAMPLDQILTKDSYRKAMDVLAAELEKERARPGYKAPARTMELEMRRADGSTVWTEVTCSLLRDDQGRPTGLLGVTRDISERKRAEQELRFAAFNDMLTGLYNRAAFMKQLQQAMDYARRYHTQMALLFIDLDRFKQVNDTFGHETGDRLLQQVARRLLKAVRKTDFVARLGGDEFTVILTGTKPIQVETVVERIGSSLARPYRFGSLTIDFVDASIGIGRYPDDGQDPEALLKAADSAMYRCKAASARRPPADPHAATA